MMNSKIIKFMTLIKKLTDGKAKIEDIVKTFLPMTAEAKIAFKRADPLLREMGLDDTIINLAVTTVTYEGKEWIALLINEAE